MREYRLALVMALVVMAWSGRALAALTTNPTPVNLGNVTVGSSVTLSVTVTSSANGRADLTVGSCSGGNGTFSLSPSTNVSLNNPVAINVTYMANGTGTQTCTVQATDAMNGSSMGSFTITATGQRPPTITGGFTTAGNFTSVRFYDSAVAQKTSTKTINITNAGDQQLSITSVMVINNGGENNFTLTTGNQMENIGGGGTRSWIVTFNPLSGGDKTGTIRFASNDANTPNFDLALVGTGTTGVLSLEQNGAFGTVPAGSARTNDITMTNIGNNTKGPLSVTSASIGNATQPWFVVSACGQTTCNFASPIQFATSTPILQVRCSPPSNAVDGTAATATLSVTADNDPGSNPVTTVPLSCTAGASVLAFVNNINSIDFGDVLVNTTTEAKSVTLTNNGSQAAQNFSVTASGANANLYTITATKGGAPCNGCTLNQNEQLVVTVTFRPTFEGYTGVQLDLANNSPVTPSFIVGGKGVDKKIDAPMAIDFPDTFRNPGSKAPVVPVTITNTGEYMLDITSLELNGGGVYELEDPATTSFTIPGLMSRDVMVRFVPAEAGKAPEGQLAVINNSSNNTMPIIRFAGNGKARNVDMSPSSINAGETFAGVPTRVSVTRPDEVLKVKNMELGDDGDFVIRKVEITGDGAAMFEVQAIGGGSLDGRALDRMDELEIDVVFKPTYAGNFTASLEVYLDEDTVAQTPVPIRGTALFVDAHGSGGCSTGRSSRGAMLLVLATVLLVLRRRCR